jgi:hypothetical protein
MGFLASRRLIPDEPLAGPAYMSAAARANAVAAFQVRTEGYTGPFLAEIQDPTGPFFVGNRRTRDAAYAAGVAECQTRGLDPVLISITDRFGKAVPINPRGN